MPRTNRLLALLSPTERARVDPQLTPVTMAVHHIVHESGGAIEYVYFPRSGVLSLITVMEDGARSEVGVVGYDGCCHPLVAVGATRSPQRVMCQVDAELDRMPVAALRAELALNGGLRSALDRYAQYLFAQVTQTTACNRHHTVPARCARWLLMTHDRANSDQFTLTHDLLSTMLGVRRPSVTLALSSLQRDGMIEYTRGRVRMVDRPRMEAMACECYRVVQAEYMRLLG